MPSSRRRSARPLAVALDLLGGEEADERLGDGEALGVIAARFLIRLSPSSRPASRMVVGARESRGDERAGGVREPQRATKVSHPGR